MPTTHAVCFDLDSTLCHSVQSDVDIHEEVFERVGVEPFFTPEDVRAVDLNEVETAESDEEFYRNLYGAVVAELGSDVTPGDDLIWDLAEVTTDVIDPSAVAFREGAADALSYARDHYEVGLITNGGEETQTAKLEQLGITDAFDTAVFCDPAQGVDPKPATEPFELALGGLSASAETTVYIGDSLSSDVAGAHRVGMRSVWTPPNRPHDTVPDDPEPTPTHRLDSLSELPTVL
jgi:putative hydrolase of the HAD superfamily